MPPSRRSRKLSASSRSQSSLCLRQSYERGVIGHSPFLRQTESRISPIAIASNNSEKLLSHARRFLHGRKPPNSFVTQEAALHAPTKQDGYCATGRDTASPFIVPPERARIMHCLA